MGTATSTVKTTRTEATPEPMYTCLEVEESLPGFTVSSLVDGNASIIEKGIQK